MSVAVDPHLAMMLASRPVGVRIKDLAKYTILEVRTCDDTVYTIVCLEPKWNLVAIMDSNPETRVPNDFSEPAVAILGEGNKLVEDIRLGFRMNIDVLSSDFGYLTTAVIDVLKILDSKTRARKLATAARKRLGHRVTEKEVTELKRARAEYFAQI